MRQSMRSSSTSLNSSSRGRCIKVILLNREELTVFVEGKAKVQDVFNQVCEHLNLRETEFFGLARLIDDEFQFAEMTTKLHKLFHKQPRSWRSQKPDDRQVLTLHFRVHYYVEHVSLLKERVTRQLYYQQLKDNLLNYSQEVSEEKCFLLASYSLQADIGNYSEEKHDSQYFDPREYFPAWVVDKRTCEYIRENMPVMHRDCHNMPKQQAAMLYIRELSRPPLPHNMHMYRVKRNKQESPGTVWVAVCPQGVHIYQDDGKFRTLLSTFLWGDIGRLHFEKKKFEIQPSGSGEPRKFRYYTGSEDRGKYLLLLCQNSHQFQMGMAPKLAEQKQYEAEDRKFRESYIYSDNIENTLGGSSVVGRWSAGKFSFSREMHGRTSTTSSQTTSGIASERLHTSLDESEDTQEILIDSPPRGIDHSHTHNHNPGLSPAASMNTCAILNNISRGSSVHSQQSGAAAQLCIPLKPADTHIQRMTFAPTMTVSSQAVMPRMAGNGGAAGGSMGLTPVHTVNAFNGPLQSSSSPHIMTSNTSPVSNSHFQQYSILQQQQQHQHNNPHIQPLSGGGGTSHTAVALPLQPQFAEPLEQQPDHTYANMESISTVLYTHASTNSGGGGCGGSNSNSPSMQGLSTPGLSMPLTSTPYQSPPDHTVYLPVPGPDSLQNTSTHPPPVSRTRDFIINRPNRSYSQVLPPNKVLSPPQRAVSNADAYIAKRPNRVDCPLHGIRPDLFREIQAKSQRKDTPLLQALCHDRFLLQQEQCICRGSNENEEAMALRRFSYSQPSSSASTPDLFNQPGTVIRPVSWHEPTSLHLFGPSIDIDIEQTHRYNPEDPHSDQEQQHFQLQNHVNSNPHHHQQLLDNPHHHHQQLLDNPHHHHQQLLDNPQHHQQLLDNQQYFQQHSQPNPFHHHHHQIHPHASGNSHMNNHAQQLSSNLVGPRYHQSMDSLDYPTMLTYHTPDNQAFENGESLFPPRLHSGGYGRLSGSQSVDNLLQTPNYSLGIVT